MTFHCDGVAGDAKRPLRIIYHNSNGTLRVARYTAFASHIDLFRLVRVFHDEAEAGARVFAHQIGHDLVRL